MLFARFWGQVHKHTADLAAEVRFIVNYLPRDAKHLLAYRTSPQAAIFLPAVKTSK
jgi:hypothetical protein